MKLWKNLCIAGVVCALVLSLCGGAQAKSFDPNSSQYKEAKASLLTASVIVLGFPFTDGEIGQRMVELVDKPYSLEAQYDDGLTFSQAVAFLKQRMHSVSFDRYTAVQMAYWETMGRGPTDDERSYWSNRIENENKWWYATLVPELTKYINQTNTAERTKAISRAYMAAFGRDATSAEQTYWMPRSEDYRIMRDANRAYMWSGAHDDELKAMATRVYNLVNKKPATNPIPDISYQFILVSFKPKKSTYQEIVALLLKQPTPVPLPPGG